MLYRSLLIFASLACARGQFGGKRNQQQAQPGTMGDVDVAMAGWDQLSRNPDKLQEVMNSFKDPEVMAKAQEMLNDPVYMAAAKKKLAELQGKAQAAGLLDKNGMPVLGAATHLAGMDHPAAQIGTAMATGGARSSNGEARDWEMENIERHRAGQMNEAELGMANLKNAMADPSVLGEVAQMLRDPENMAQLKKMMADPSFQAQAKRVAEQMKASGDLPDFSKIQQQAQAFMQQQGGGGAAAAELARLRRENEQLRRANGI